TVAGEVRSTRGGTTRVATGVVMVAAGLFLLVFLGLTVRLAALVVGVALVVHGAGQALDAVRGSRPRDERAAAIMLGLAGVVLGVLALVWPDVTLLVTSVVLGVRLVVLGVVHGRSAMTGRSRRAGAPRAPRPAGAGPGPLRPPPRCCSRSPRAASASTCAAPHPSSTTSTPRRGCCPASPGG